MTVSNWLVGPGIFLFTTASGLGGLNLTSSTHAFGFKFCVPKTGTIEKVGFYISGNTGSPPDYSIGIETLGADGLPTGSAYGGSSADAFSPTPTGWRWHTLATPASATVSNFVAVVLKAGGTAPDGSNYITVVNEIISSFFTLPQLIFKTVGAWSSTGGIGLMGIMYDDGDVYGISGTYPGIAEYHQDDAIDEIAAKFSLPFAMTISGAIVGNTLNLDTSAPFDVVLYDQAGTAQRTISISDEDYPNAPRTAGSILVHFAPYTIPANTVHRLAMKATSDTLGIQPPVFDFDSASDLANNLLMPGLDWILSTRVDGGSWTDDDTMLPAFGLLVHGEILAVGPYGWAS